MIRNILRHQVKPSTLNKTNILGLRLFSTATQTNIENDTTPIHKHEFLKQIYRRRHEINVSVGFIGQEPMLNFTECCNDKDSFLEGQELRTSGENTIYVSNQTLKKLYFEEEAEQFFLGPFDLYLVCIRFLEASGIHPEINEAENEELIKYCHDVLQKSEDGEDMEEEEVQTLDDIYSHLITKY